MDNKKAIARAIKTKATQAPQTQGAASGVTGMGSLAAYGAWNYGTSFANSLPRTQDTFMSGAFSPLTPINPVGIDVPDEDSGRPKPRRFQYPVGWNMPVGQPGSEGLKLVTFANLRLYADMYSVVRACIQVRKEEILGLDWDIVPTDQAQRDMRGDPDAHDDFQKRRQEVLDFFRRPDPNYHDFVGWLGAVLEEIFVVDALSIYLHPTRVPGKGLLGSDLAALELLDGTTIRPLLDVHGQTPRPPSPAYQQYLYGVPRTDMMDIILQSDLEGMDDPVAQYRGDQIMYLPYTRRSFTPYGFPGIERAIIPVMTGLRRQQWQLEYFAEGTIPGQFVVPGDDISTPAQIRQLQDTLNAIAGDQAWKHKIIVLPRGSSTKDQKNIELAGTFDEQLVMSVCMAYDVMPMELGIMQGSGGQSPNQTNMVAQASAEISKRKALKPMISWLKSAIFDHVLQDICEQTDMQWAWLGLESADDEAAKAENFKTLTGVGLMSIDEARVSMGMSPWGLPLTSDPVYMSATGVSTLGTVDPATSEAYFNNPPIVSPEAVAAQHAEGTPVAVGQGGQPAAPPAPPGTPPGSPTPSQPNASVGLPAAGGRPPGGGGTAPTVQTNDNPNAATPLHGNQKSNPEDAKQNAKDRAVKKAIDVEFDTLRRHLKKGRSVDGWKAEFISMQALLTVAKAIDEGKDVASAIAEGKKIEKASQRLARRNDAMTAAATSVVTNLGSLASGITSAKTGPINFIDQGVNTLRDGYLQVMNSAAQHAADDHSNVSPVVPGGFQQIAADRAEAQRGFLTGMAQDVVEGRSDAQMKQRLALYSRSLLPAYEHAYGLTVTSGQAIGNQASAPNPTRASATNEPSPYSIDTYTPDDSDAEQGDMGDEEGDTEFAGEFSDEEIAPGGVPSTATDGLSALDDVAIGAGLVGAGAVLGGALDDTTPDDTSAADTGTDGLDSLEEVTSDFGLGSVLSDGVFNDDGTSEGDDPGSFDEEPRSYIIWHAEGEGSDSYEPCDLCAERDGQTYTMDTLPCWPGDGGFGEYCDGAANCNCWLEYTDDAGDSEVSVNPMKDWANGFYAQRSAEEAAHDQAAIDARAADIASVAETNPEAAARMAARDALYGVPNTRYGPDGRYDPSGPRYGGSADDSYDPNVLYSADDDVTASAVARLTKSVHDVLKAGNPEALAAWYESGADGQINWGESGDFDACVAIAGQYLDDPEGYCQLRHMAATGETTSEHAAEDKATKSKYEDIIDEGDGEPADRNLYNEVIEAAKRKFDVYPSAYANGWVVQEYKRRGGTYRKVVTKGSDDTFSPPQGVRNEAKRALEWIKQGHAGDGFTDTGRKRASDLAAGHDIGLDTIKRMASFLARHEVDKHGTGWSPGHPEYPSPGRVAWAAWGGDPAKSWVEGILSSHGDDDKVEKFSPDQPRDDHGRFAAVTGGLTPERVAEAVSDARAGGFSLDPRNGNTPTTGFQIGGHAEPLRIELSSKMSSAEVGAQIVAYVEQHQDLFKSDPSMYLGGWVQPGDENHSEHLCIEPSKNVRDREEAIALGGDLNQISIWDNENFEEIDTGGNGEFIGKQ